MDDNKDYFFRVISNQVRFGCGYRTVGGKRQYFAWHGYPNRNSDYFTTSEISREEFDEINRKYPKRDSCKQRKGRGFPKQIRRRTSCDLRRMGQIAVNVLNSALYMI